MQNYIVIGNPVKHSLSPMIHTAFAEQTKQELQYGLLECPVDDFEREVKNFIKDGGQGLSVTLPFKERAFAMADEVSERAQAAKASSVMKIENGKIIAENFDGCGLVTDIKNNLKFDITNKKILIAGAGGAVQGILHSLLDKNPQSICIVNRTIAKAEKLAEQNEKISASNYESLSGEFDLIINGTSLSVYNKVPAISQNILTASTLCYDLMYNREADTAFVAWAKQHGVQASDGLGMLVEQAVLSFEFWRGIKPDASFVYKIIKS